MKSKDFDTLFYVGGHGPMWDLVDNPNSIARNIAFGIREHAMGAAVNGMAAHGGVLPFSATF
jgi:transketolase